MSWPAPDTLRAILDLPGVSGSTRADIEMYLDDPDGWGRALGDYWSLGGHCNLEAQTDKGVEAYLLSRALPVHVQAHYAQLVERKAV